MLLSRVFAGALFVNECGPLTISTLYVIICKGNTDPLHLNCISEMPEFNILVKQHLKNSGLLQSEVARCMKRKQASFNSSQLTRWKEKTKHPRFDHVLAFADCIGLNRVERDNLLIAAGYSDRLIDLELEKLESSEILDYQVNRTGLRDSPFKWSDEFIGRQSEIETIKRLLVSNRLVTLTGVGGIGKSRLADEAAKNLTVTYADDVLRVELAELTHPEQILSTLAQALNIKREPQRSPMDAIVSSLGNRHILLLFDNCEHLIRATAKTIVKLLQACPNIAILATSREPLALPHEILIQIPPLTYPLLERSHQHEELYQYESVRLFLSRIVTKRFDYKITVENAPYIARICSALDGIPLAIELAAGTIEHVSVRTISQALHDHAGLLLEGGHNVLARHQTMQACFDWSYDLLGQEERALFRRLAVFAGGWTLMQASTICWDEQLSAVDFDPATRSTRANSYHILNLLSSLTNKSLIICERKASEDARYHFLAAVRQYAYAKLGASSETQKVRTKHLIFFLGLAERAAPNLLKSDQIEWLQKLEEEFDNIRTAIEWAIEKRKTKFLFRMGWALFYFLLRRGYWHDGRLWMEKGLALSKGEKPSLENARARYVAGYLAYAQGDSSAALSHLAASIESLRKLGSDGRYTLALALRASGRILTDRNLRSSLGQATEVLQISAEVGDQWLLANAFSFQGEVLMYQGDYSLAAQSLEQSIKLLDLSGDQCGATAVKGTLGFVFLRRGEEGDRERARLHFEQALILYEQVNDLRGIAIMRRGLGDVAKLGGNYAESRRLYEKCIAIWNELGSVSVVANLYLRLGGVAFDEGNLQSAKWYYKESLRRQTDLSGLRHLSITLISIARLLVKEKQFEIAAILFSFSIASLETISVNRNRAETNEDTRNLDLLRFHLSEEQLARHWGKGSEISIEEAISITIRALGDS